MTKAGGGGTNYENIVYVKRLTSTSPLREHSLSHQAVLFIPPHHRAVHSAGSLVMPSPGYDYRRLPENDSFVIPCDSKGSGRFRYESGSFEQVAGKCLSIMLLHITQIDKHALRLGALNIRNNVLHTRKQGSACSPPEGRRSFFATGKKNPHLRRERGAENKQTYYEKTRTKILLVYRI